METNLSKEQEWEKEKLSCLIRHLRLSSTSNKLLRKWRKKRGESYYKWIVTEMESDRHR